MKKQEVYKDIPGIPNYQASNLGNIRSKPRVIIRSNGWPHTIRSRVMSSANHRGYRKVAIIIDGELKTRAVHRLVAKTFLPNPKQKETVNHKNGIKSDNRITNLEWATREENIAHAIDTGLFEKCHLIGSQIGNSKLKEHQVREIKRKFIPRIYSRAKLADEYNVSQAAIKDILYGRSWAHVE